MGGHTGMLASADLDCVEEYSGILRMGAVPVALSRPAVSADTT